MLKQRIITAVILFALLCMATISLPPFYFSLIIALIVLAASWEWSKVAGIQTQAARLGYVMSIGIACLFALFLIGASPAAEAIDKVRALVFIGLGQFFWIFSFSIIRRYPANKTAWNDQSRVALMGLFVLIPTLCGFVYLKYLVTTGFLVLALVVLVAAVDVGAYFVGKAVGSRKLAPALSPNKTWEGVWGGLTVCVLFTSVFAWLLTRYITALTPVQYAVVLLLSLFITCFSIIGDLFESMLKRNQDLKDSGQLLPGHGGVLDRVDGLVAATPSFCLVMAILLDGATNP